MCKYENKPMDQVLRYYSLKETEFKDIQILPKCAMFCVETEAYIFV